MEERWGSGWWFMGCLDRDGGPRVSYIGVVIVASHNSDMKTWKKKAINYGFFIKDWFFQMGVFYIFFLYKAFLYMFFFFKFIMLGFHQNYKNWKHLYFFLSRMKISNWKILWLDFLFSWMCRISSNNFSSFTWIFNLWKIILFSILLLFIWSSIILLDLSLSYFPLPCSSFHSLIFSFFIPFLLLYYLIFIFYLKL
jgi:hypothetical protein